MSMLDETHTPLSHRSRSDSNTYILGKIAQHNVVMACLPAGKIGTHNAATAAAQMIDTFEFIRFGLMVGVGGGVPSAMGDVRLGDVVVSKPSQHYGGVVQYDFGKSVENGSFKRSGSLNAPPRVLLNALSVLIARQELNRNSFTQFLSNVLPTLPSTFSRPGLEEDCLFEAEYDHVGDATCAQCDVARLVPRSNRDSLDPCLHYGTIASGNRVIKNGTYREQLRKDYNVLCFEMEAGGLMNDFPCVVIRGISDYADSHKNQRWKRYAATAAAAYAKELLSVIPPEQVAETPRMPPSPHVDGESSVQSEPRLDANLQGIGNSRFFQHVSQTDPLSSSADNQIRSTLPEFSFLTSGCLGPNEVALGRLVLNLDAPADDYCPHVPIAITQQEVSVVPFPGIASFLAHPKGSRFSKYVTTLLSGKIDKRISIPEYVSKTMQTSRLLNSGDFFKRLIQDENIKRWIEANYKETDVYLVVGIHSFTDIPASATASVASLDPQAAFSIPGNWIIGVRYRRVKVKGFYSSKVDSAFLNQCGRWKKYVIYDPNRKDEEADILESQLDDDIALDDLLDGYNVDIYRSDETGEPFLFIDD